MIRNILETIWSVVNNSSVFVDVPLYLNMRPGYVEQEHVDSQLAPFLKRFFFGSRSMCMLIAVLYSCCTCVCSAAKLLICSI